MQVKRIDSAPEVSGARPCIVSFAAWKDKENVLRQAKLLKGCGIYITEDVSHKNGECEGSQTSTYVVPSGVRIVGAGSQVSSGEQRLEPAVPVFSCLAPVLGGSSVLTGGEEGVGGVSLVCSLSCPSCLVFLTRNGN